MKETLTKENFWDEMEQKYPKAMAHFKQWIDTYKLEHDWDRLFNAGIEHYTDEVPGLYGSAIRHDSKAPKYHELPIAMQFGIFCEYLYFVDQQKHLDLGIHLQTNRDIGLIGFCKLYFPWAFAYLEGRL